jgi:xylulose-5-phosphate/fructose-6-phosphate phosphoketolase
MEQMSHMTMPDTTASPPSGDELDLIDTYWRASLYLCAGMLYLKDNPLLKEPLASGHIKKRLLGHWGSDAGGALLWTHLNRRIRMQEVDVVFISGPGHGAPAILAHAWLEGTYGEVYPDKGQGEQGLRRFSAATK